MNDGIAHVALVTGPAATWQAARSARPDAPVVPEDPRWEARRRRRRQRAGQRGRSRSRLGCTRFGSPGIFGYSGG